MLVCLDKRKPIADAQVTAAIVIGKNGVVAELGKYMEDYIVELLEYAKECSHSCNFGKILVGTVMVALEMMEVWPVASVPTKKLDQFMTALEGLDFSLPTTSHSSNCFHYRYSASIHTLVDTLVKQGSRRDFYISGVTVHWDWGEDDSAGREFLHDAQLHVTCEL